METTRQRLESLFEAVRELPEDAQEAAVAALSEITGAPYQLSADEWSVLEPALARARRGEFADEAGVSELLDSPWRKRSP